MDIASYTDFIILTRGILHAFKSSTLWLKSVFKTQNSFQNTKSVFKTQNHVFKSQIKFSKHKSSTKSVYFQITYAKFTCDGPLVLTTNLKIIFDAERLTALKSGHIIMKANTDSCRCQGILR